VVLTSHNEGTPLSLIEAQAAAKPVVSTNVGGVADVVLNGKTGFVTEAGNENQLADSILKLIADEELRKKFGVDGREFANSKFSYQRLMRDMSEYYNTLLKKN
jgi:glycosyltransferase involved in cell wall biosynthesis